MLYAAFLLTNVGDMASTGPEFSVIIVAYNSGHVLSKCLAALARQTFTDFEILLVDNGVNDGAVEALGSVDPRTRIIRPGHNLGFAAGNNLAAREARANWLVLLNPDAFPAPDWLTQIGKAIRRYPSVAMFGSTQFKADDPLALDGAGDCYHPLGLAWRGGEGETLDMVDVDTEVFGPCAAAAAYRKGTFEEAGGFAEQFFCYYEDVDLAFRLRLAGATCVQLAAARVGHVGSSTTGKGSDFIRYQVTRNRIWTFLRGMPGPLLLFLLPGLIATLVMRLSLTPFTGDFRTRARAITDAFGALPRVLRERRDIQARRRVGAMEVARVMTWSVRKLALRARDCRPLTVTRVPEDYHDAA